MYSINRTLLPANLKLKIVSHGFCDLQRTFLCLTVPHCKHDTSTNVFGKKALIYYLIFSVTKKIHKIISMLEHVVLQ